MLLNAHNFEEIPDDEAAYDHDLTGLLARLSANNAVRPAANAAEQVEQALIFHGASPKLIEQILRRSKDADSATQLLSSGLHRLLKFSSCAQGSETRLMLIGAPAVGKSSMIAKLASLARSNAPVVFSTDINRPGGMQRLTEYLSVLGIVPQPIDQSIALPAEMAALAGSILIDTAGIDAADRMGQGELSGLARTMKAELVLVVSALSDPGEARELGLRTRDLGTTRLFITRLDMARRLGTVLAAAEAGLTLCLGSITANFAYGLMPLTPVLLADRLLALADAPNAVA